MYIILIPRDMNNAWEWFLSRQSVVRTNFEQWNFRVFSLYALESGGYFNSVLEYIESYVVLAEQQSRIPYVWQKFRRFDQVLSTGGFEFSGPYPPSSLSRIGLPRARQIYVYGVSLFKKGKKLTPDIYGTVHG